LNVAHVVDGAMASSFAYLDEKAWGEFICFHPGTWFQKRAIAGIENSVFFWTVGPNTQGFHFFTQKS
jgi:hypothetical protein